LAIIKTNSSISMGSFQFNKRRDLLRARALDHHRVGWLGASEHPVVPWVRRGLAEAADSWGHFSSLYKMRNVNLD
jgi:hypothetical protein